MIFLTCHKHAAERSYEPAITQSKLSIPSFQHTTTSVPRPVKTALHCFETGKLHEMIYASPVSHCHIRTIEVWRRTAKISIAVDYQTEEVKQRNTDAELAKTWRLSLDLRSQRASQKQFVPIHSCGDRASDICQSTRTAADDGPRPCELNRLLTGGGARN
jgi:hypothetical protein